MSVEMDERELRKQIEKRVQMRFELIVHAVIFLVVNAGFWLAFGYAFWLVLMTLCCMLALAGHSLYYVTQSGMLSKLKQNAVEREMQREMALRGTYEKPKNDSQMRLTDDGEIEEVLTDEDEELYQNVRTSR